MIDVKVANILDEAFQLIDTGRDGGIDVREYISAFSDSEVVLHFMSALRA